MKLNEFMKVRTLDGLISPTSVNVTYFNLCDTTCQMASELNAIKDSMIFRTCWKNQVEELSRDQSDTDNTDRNEEIYTLDQVYNKIFQSCYNNYKKLYDSLKSGELLLEEIDNIFEGYKGKCENLKNDLDIMCRVDTSDNRTWIKERVNQIQQYQDVHLAVESSKIIEDIKSMLCPEGDFSVLERLLQMVCLKLLNIIKNKVIERNSSPYLQNIHIWLTILWWMNPVMFSWRKYILDIYYIIELLR